MSPQLSLTEAIEQLSHPQAPRRRSAARRLAVIGDRHACEPLCAALRVEVTKPRAWEGPAEMAKALRRCGCSGAIDTLQELMVMDLWGSAANHEMADAYVTLATHGPDDLRAVHFCLGLGLHKVTIGAFRAAARMGQSGTDGDVAAFHAAAIAQQIDLQGTNAQLDLRYPLLQAAQNWTGPATTKLLTDAFGSGNRVLSELATAAGQGRLAGMMYS